MLACGLNCLPSRLNGKPQYSYDSDEDIDDQGTWEHKKRAAEMKKTALQAQALTQAGHDKHHLADFLPQAELEKFLDPAAAAQRKQTANQLTQSNLGFQMLQKAGWNQGQGLGVAGQGMTVPVASNGAGAGHAGLGTTDPTEPSANDDPFNSYRKRMMTAYKFRPNPFNNPRRKYYQ
eukprot:m.195829 g.195829  ORF g.195829 m.195829 type:complete len:177 (-) comp17007_c0_seq1:922-1452(-)